MTRATRTLLSTWPAALAAALIVAATDLAGLARGDASEHLPAMAWRLALVAVVVAGAAALALAAAGGASRWLVRRTGRPRLWTLPYLALAAPWAIAVSILFFSGGSTRHLWWRPAGIPLLAIGALVALDLGCRLARVLRRRVRGRRPLAITVFAVGSLAALGLAAANRHVLPGLYDYLHASLALGSFLLVYAAASTWPAPRARALPLVALAAGTGLAVFGMVHGLTHGHVVRAALGRPQAPGSRAVLAWLGPLVASADPPPAPAARRGRVRFDDDPTLPTWPGAHVLLVTIDALRADRLGVYGNTRRLSPAIDALAAEGVVFERAYTQAPHSSYSLSSLMASEYVHATVRLGREPPEATLPRVLRRAGYRAEGIYTDGIFHTHGENFERYRATEFGLEAADHRSLDAEERTDAALARLDAIEAAGEPASFLWVHYFDVHEPYVETSLGTSLPDRYDGEVRNVDRALGRLVREARRRLSRQVVLLITADHGEELRDHGGLYHGSTLYEEQVRVPLIVSAPGLSARRVPDAVELVDLAPTILAALGERAPESMRGDDLRPLMTGGRLELSPAMSAVGDRAGAFDGRWKLIADLGSGVFELYDLERDPRERQNLADERPEELARLHAQLRGWLGSLGEAPASAEGQALERARLGDADAIPVLASMLAARRGSARERLDAAHELGALGGDDARRGLAAALRDEAPEVRAEAAIALGTLGDPRAGAALRALLHDPSRRTRAALALARLDDDAAVPVLVDVLARSEDRVQREEAAQWLGRLEDPRAYDALIAALEVERVRRYAAEALGRLGDRRAVAPLHALLDPGIHMSVRSGAMLGLARLGAPESIAPLVRLAVDAPEVQGTSEGLVRLGALEHGAIGGVDFAPGLRGVPGCRRHRGRWDEPFVGRTTCELARTVEVPLRTPPAAPAGYAMLVRARALEGTTRIELRLAPGGNRPVDLGPHWTEVRFELPSGEGRAERLVVELPEAVAVELDHVLLVPRLPAGPLSARAVGAGPG